MKKIFLWIPFLFLPFSVFAQQSLKPSDFHGIMTIEDGQPIRFTSLNNPLDGTNISFYPQKPNKEQYERQESRRLLSFNQISRLKILPVSRKEGEELRNIAGDEMLYKAELTLRVTDPTIPEVVYLNFKWFEWKSDIMKGFPGTYRMEVALVDEIEFQ